MKQGSYKTQFLGTEYPVYYIKDASIADQILKELCESQIELFAVDIETEALPKYKSISTAALSPLLSKPRLIQIFDGEAAYVFDCKYIGTYEIFRTLLSTKKFVAHNAIFELGFFKSLGFNSCNIGCTRILAKLLYDAKRPVDDGTSLSLGSLVRIIFDGYIVKEMGKSDWSKPELTWEQVEYAGLDAIVTLLLAEKMAPSLVKNGLQKIYTITKDAQHAIAELQLNGILLDVDKHREMIPVWREELYKAKLEVLELTGLDDLTPHKLAKWLEKNLDEESLHEWPRTETGKLSTNAKTFADFEYLDIVAPYSKFQKMEKLASTFGSSLINQVNPATGRLHASYNLCGARTGRLSSSKPNLQQCPARGPGAHLRKNFIASEGKVLVCADYGQIELRVAAEVSKDPAMLQAFRDGIDLHKLTAATISGCSVEEILDDDIRRYHAKAFNFGLLFGLGPRKFSKYAKQSYGVDITQKDAERSIEIWRELYCGYREWQLYQASSCAQTMSVRTPSGKLRKLNEDNCYGASMNTPVQGGAAEVMLIALSKLSKTFAGNGARLVNCVHDEVLVECEESEVEEVKHKVESEMTKAFLEVFPEGCTRGLVDAGSGASWGDAK